MSSGLSLLFGLLDDASEAASDARRDLRNGESAEYAFRRLVEAVDAAKLERAKLFKSEARGTNRGVSAPAHQAFFVNRDTD